MARPSFFPPAATLILLCAASLAACGDGGQPTGEAPAATPVVETPAAQMPTTAAPSPVEAPVSEPVAAPAELSGGLPLTPGVYVVSGSPCASPANAAFRIYDGRGLSGSTTRACRLTVRSRDGDVWRVDQSCEDTYSGQRTTAAQTISARSAGAFTLTEQGEAPVSYRLCPTGEVPVYLQDKVTVN